MISDQAQEAYEVNCAIPRQHGYVRVIAQVKLLLEAIHYDYISYLILPNLMTIKIDELDEFENQSMNQYFCFLLLFE